MNDILNKICVMDVSSVSKSNTIEANSSDTSDYCPLIYQVLTRKEKENKNHTYRKSPKSFHSNKNHPTMALTEQGVHNERFKRIALAQDSIIWVPMFKKFDEGLLEDLSKDEVKQCIKRAEIFVVDECGTMIPKEKIV